MESENGVERDEEERGSKRVRGMESKMGESAARGVVGSGGPCTQRIQHSPKSGMELETSSGSSFLRSFFPEARGRPPVAEDVVGEEGEEGVGGGQSDALIRSGGRVWSGRGRSWERRASRYRAP